MWSSSDDSFDDAVDMGEIVSSKRGWKSSDDSFDEDAGVCTSVSSVRRPKRKQFGRTIVVSSDDDIDFFETNLQDNVAATVNGNTIPAQGTEEADFTAVGEYSSESEDS
ncbi:unnamed protein product [Mucor circinelloides]